MNKVFLNGYIFKEPTLKTSANDLQICNFSMLVPDIKNPQSESYINLVAFGNLAVTITNSFHKGQMLSIDGRLRTSSYVNPEDNKRTFYTEVIVDNVQLIDGQRPQRQPQPNNNETIDYKKVSQQIEKPIDVSSVSKENEDWDELDYFTEETDNE